MKLFSYAAITLLLFVSSTAFAATQGNITISGNVAGATSIVVSTESGYNSLDLHTTTTDQKVASIREINNTAGGYTVSLASSNGGELQNGSLGGVTYSAKYDGVSVALSSTPVTITDQGAQSSIINVVKDLQISYTGVPAEQLMEGVYTDTLTFTIAAK